MFSYQHHIGDFNKATRHLTRIERSIYRDMLDLYYETEKPLPDDINYICRIVIARTNEEVTAVEQVLKEFFHKNVNGWAHVRCELEIERYRNNSNIKSAAGKASAAARAAKRQQIINGCLTGVGTEAQQKTNTDSTNHKPKPITSTLNQEPELNTAAQDKPAKTKKAEYPEWFESIWDHYPTRTGGDNKKMAYQKANARIKSGKTVDELYAAVDRYKFYVVATGKVSTEYVKQAVTFFGSDDNIDNQWDVPTNQNARPFARPKEKFNPVAYMKNRSAGNGKPAIEGAVINHES